MLKRRLRQCSESKMQDTGYRIQDKKNHASCIMHHTSVFTRFTDSPIHRFTLLLFCASVLLLLSSCTAKRVELPDYEGVDVRTVITERKSIKGVNATFHVEFEKTDSTMTGDAALELTDETLDLRIYSLGFLGAELTEANGMIKSNPELSRSIRIILVEGLRSSMLWWLIKDYEIEEQNGNYHIINSSRKIIIDKKTMLPISQTIELDPGKELRISYEEPANSDGFWYPSIMKIELSKYIVKLQIKSISFIPHSAQGQ